MAEGLDLLRKKLSQSARNLVNSTDRNCESYLAGFLKLLDETPMLKDVVAPIEGYELDFRAWEDQLRSEGSQFPPGDTERAAMCLVVLRRSPKMNDMFGIGIGLNPGETRILDLVQTFTNEFVPPLYEWLDEQLELRGAEVTPEAIFGERMRYIDAVVSDRYPSVHGKLQTAMGTLNTGSSPAEWSAVGHYCREAVQDFADALYREYYSQADQVPMPIEKTLNRIRAVLDQRRGQNKKPSLQRLLEALYPYWQEVTDYVERAEHRGHQEGGITREDAKRCVLYSYLVMAELALVVSS